MASSPSPSSAEAAEAALEAAAPTIEWLQCLELGYVEDSNNSDSNEWLCFQCSTPTKSNKRCQKCLVATYCSRECQVKHWKKGPGGGHKFACNAYGRVGTGMKITSQDDQAAARREIFGRIRFYACPYAVYKELVLGRGFVFLQSSFTLAELSLPLPIASNGKPMSKTRSVLLHYLTMGEYDSEVCRDDFELTEVRTKLKDAVESYDKQAQLVVLMRFRCGHVALGIAPLVPDYGICKSLGQSYYAESGSGALQLNLDDI